MVALVELIIILIIIIIIIFFITVKTTLFNLTSITINNNSLSHRTTMKWSRRTATARFRQTANINGAKLLKIQSSIPGLHLKSTHQMAPPKQGSTQ